MISKIRPYFDIDEIVSPLSFTSDSVHKFEKRFAKLVRSKYAIALPYGRMGIFSALKLNPHKGEVILPSYTCMVVPNSVVLEGEDIRFVDTEKDGFNMDLSKIEKELSSKTKAIVPTHMFGYPMDIAQVRELVPSKTLIIEDCALALLSKHRGKYVGNQGDVAIHSLNIGKFITTIEGGFITTNNDQVYENLNTFFTKNFRKPSPKTTRKVLMKFATSYLLGNPYLYSGIYKVWNNLRFAKRLTQNWDFDSISLPDNCFEFFTSVQAKIGLAQLKKTQEIIENRNKNVLTYNKKINNENVKLPKYDTDISYSHYPVLVKNRQAFLRYMEKNRVHLGINFEYSIPYTKLYKKYKKKECPNSLKIASEVVNLPIYPGLRRSELNEVIDLVNDWK